MTRRTTGAAALILALALIAAAPARAADADNGADLFDTHCGDCHSVASRIANRKGPSLYRVFGRRAGTVAGARYSPEMVQSGIMWTAQTLDAYLANPKAVIRTGIMKFRGLPNAGERADLIAYLATVK
jgi:cytochrome c